MRIIAALLALIGRFFNGLADIFRRPAAEATGESTPFFDSLESLPEELDDDFVEVRDPETRIFLDEPDSFGIGEAGETILFDERNRPVILFNEAGRTVARVNCRIEAFFGLAVYDNRKRSRGQFRFSQLQPEITLTNNGSLGIRIGIKSVGDFPGALSITVTRDAPGTANPDPISFTATDMAGVKAETDRRPEIPIPPPPNMSANNPVVTETIIAGVSWDPDDADPCAITPPEKLRVTWNFVNPRATFGFSDPTMSKTPSRRSSVRIGESVIQEKFPDGRTQFTVAVQSFFVVADPNVCCGATGEYAVIQFVRHRFNLRERPPKKNEDTWSLDILDTEGQLARDGKAYDPTFTHNPRDAAPGVPPPPLVYPGPNGAGSAAINQIDRPGISQALYDRFAMSGGKFVFQFLSLLVCKVMPSEAANYLATGQVNQMLMYEIAFNFEGGGSAPTVSGKMLEVEAYSKCKSLRDFIDMYDRRNGGGKTGRLADGYRAPRNHEVGIPK